MSTPHDEIALDERAGRAVAELDEKVSSLDVPEFSARKPSESRRWPFAVAAAGIAAVVLVATFVFVVDDGRDNTVAGGDDEPEGLSYLVLPDPESVGLRIVGAFDALDGSSSTTVAPGVDPEITNPSVTVYGPSALDDPWTAPVVAFEGTAVEMVGDSVDLGGVVGTVGSTTYGDAVTWTDGDSSRHLLSARLDRDELVNVATQVASAGGSVHSGIPGHEILYSGRFSDVYPIGDVDVWPSPEAQGLAYQSEGGDSTLILTFTPASQPRLQAATALSFASTVRESRGFTMLESEFFGDVAELAWVEDNTLVRMTWYGEADLSWLAERLEPLSTDAFEEVVRQAAAGPGGGRGQVTTPYASAVVQRGSKTYSAILGETDEGQIRLQVEASDATSSRGAAASLESLDDASRNIVWLLQDHSVVGGVLGPGLRSIEVVDARTGELIPVLESEIVDMPGSTHDLFIALLDLPPGDAPVVLEVRGTLDDGSEVRVNSE